MKKLMIFLLLVLIMGCTQNNKSAFKIIQDVNEKYKNFENFKAVKITRQQGYIITAVEELYLKSGKYKAIEDNKITICDGETIWEYKIDNQEPEPIVIYSPDDNASVDKNLDFNFYSLEDEIYSYTVQIDKNKFFASDVLYDLTNGTEFYWRIYATDIYGNSNKAGADIRKLEVNGETSVDSKISLKPYESINQIEYDLKNPKKNLLLGMDNSSEMRMEEVIGTIVEISENIVKSEEKDKKMEVKQNQIIYYTGLEFASPKISKKDFRYIDEIQWVYEILDLYAFDFEMIGEENNHYIIKGEQAKDRVKNALWNSVDVLVSKKDYTIWKLRLYQEIDEKEYLTQDYTYEDISFEELDDSLFEYHEEEKKMD
ncbi:MAG: hypothetical protein ABIC04_01475 [Nanoarchaeota archaeon]